MTTDIDDFLRREIEIGSFPSAVYAFGSPRGLAGEGALGHAVAVPFRVPATLSTIYDCASLTKPLITATLVLQAVAENRISLDDEYEGHSYRRLLTHTSGLAAWLPLYTSDDYVRMIREQGSEYEPGTKVVYSDLNFVLLYHALVRLYGDYVARAKETIFAPLDLSDADARAQMAAAIDRLRGDR